MAKKRKEETVTLSGAESSAVAAPSSVGSGGDDSRTFPARSSSRGLEERPGGASAPTAPLAPEVPVLDAIAEVPKAQEPPVSQAVVMLPPPLSAAPLVPGLSASSDVLDRALSEIVQLCEDLQGTDSHLAAGRLELVSGWLHSDASV